MGYLADMRHAGRALLRRPGFTALAVVTMAMGIGAATGIFSLAEAMLLRPLPLPESDRLVRLFSTNPTRGPGWSSVSYPDYVDLATRPGLFQGASYYRPVDRDVSGGREPERVRAIEVGGEFFQTLGTQAHVGRLFSASDHDPASDATVVLSQRFWALHFGADSTILGRTIRLDGVPYTAIGVVPAPSAWPATADLWTPLQWAGAPPAWVAARSNHSLQVIARLLPDIDVASATAQVRAMSQAIYSGSGIDTRDEGTEALVVPLHSSDMGEDGGLVFATLGTAVALVLLIACLNASGLILARSWSRARELSLRAALGASRGRLIVALLSESLILALLGGALGVGLAHVALQKALAMAAPTLSGLSEVRLNATVLGAALAVSILAAVLTGLLPAIRATRASVSHSFKEGSSQSGQGRERTRLRQTLIVTELAVSLALLTCAGLVLRGFERQMSADPGFEASNLLSFTVRLPAARYAEDALVNAFFTDAVSRLEARPGIRAASATSWLPLGGGGTSLFRSFVRDGGIDTEGAEVGALWIEVDPEFFETLGVQPLRGRAFTESDGADAPPVAIVNERFAGRMAPDDGLVGTAIRSIFDEDLARTVVGILPDIQFNGVSRALSQPVVLVPRTQSPRSEMAFLVRTGSSVAEAVPQVREVLGEIDSDVAIDGLQTLRDAHAADLAGLRFLTTLFAAFGTLALVLSVSGVYGLVSYSVSQRTREFGVRIAIGATTGTVRGEVLRESATLAGLGVALGLVFAYAGARVLAAAMDGIAVLEPSTFVGVVALLVVAVLAASWLPARRATRVDPVVAMRSE